jgi:putative ABC transport system ATP-binding protein
VSAATAGAAPASGRALLARALRRNARPVVLSFVLMSLWQLSEAMVPVVVGQLIDAAVVTGSAGALLWWGSLLVVAFAALMVFYRYGALIAYRVDQAEGNRLRSEVAQHVLRPVGARTGKLSGDTLSLATNDADGVGTLAQSAGNVLSAVAAVAVSGAVLLHIDTVVGVTVLLGVPVVTAVTQLVTPVIARRSQEQRGHVAETSATAVDLVHGLRVIKGVGAEDEAAKRYALRSQVAKSAGVRVAGSQALLKSLSTGLSGLFLAVVTLLAGRRALDGSITVGELITIVGLTQFYAAPVHILGQTGAIVAESFAAANRISGFLATPPLLTAGTSRTRSTVPALRLDGVTAGALKDFSLHTRPGELICLVVDDPTSTGSLVGLLAGELPAGSPSQVRLDGTPLQELSPQARGENLLVNPHRAELFHGTLRDNLDPERRRGDAELLKVLEAVSARDIVGLHAGGLDQPVTAKGSTYSGGQRQRISLARALAAEPPLLVLDDPTSAVDAVTERRIASGIKELRHSGETRTTVIITTSPALLSQADRVVLCTDGRVAAIGSHRELLDRPEYEEMVLR